MNPLTVTWSPHMYTDIGKKNFESWLHNGGFDNFLYTPNPKVQRKITKEAVKNISKLTLAEKIDKHEKMRKIPDKKKNK